MKHEHRIGGALWRAILAAFLVFGFSAGAESCAQAHVRAASRHHHHLSRKGHHHRRARHQVSLAEFERGLAAAKPIITIPAAGGAPEIVVFGRVIDEPSGGVGLLADMGTTVNFGLERTAAGAGSIYRLVADSARRLAAPVWMALAIAHLESGGSCSKIGGVGERGPLQIRPQTAWAMGLRPHSCAEWINASVRYLKLAVAMHGAGCGGASAYNLGTYTRGTYCTTYGRTIMALARGAPTLRAALFEARWTPRIHHHHHRLHHLARAWTFSDSPPLSPA